MKIENTVVFGFQPAFRAMRNPKNSWSKSDSKFYFDYAFSTFDGGIAPESPVIGPDDMRLACALVKSGGDHRKFLRQIIIWADLTLARYIWQELDTYKVATVRNSCSTMHKLGSRDLEPSDFECEQVFPEVLDRCNVLGRMSRDFLASGDSQSATITLRTLKRHLPEGFLQKATYTMSYETALKMYYARVSHRMEEWSGEGGICQWIRKMPCMEQFIQAVKER